MNKKTIGVNLWRYGVLRSHINIGYTVFALICLLSILGCGPHDDIVWTPGNAKLSGHVRDAQNSPLGQASVVLEGTKTYSTFTDKNGEYEIENIDEGMYDMVVHRTINGVDYRYRVRFLEMQNDEILSMLDIRLNTPGSIQGVATLRGSGQYNPTYPNNSNIRVEVVGTSIDTLTDANGNYTLSPVEVAVGLGQGLSIPAAATYELLFSRDGYGAKTIHNVSITPSTVTSIPAVELLPLSPSPIGALAGRVTLEAALNDDYANVKVSIDGTTKSILTTSGGYYRFNDLHAGVYNLRFQREDYFDHRQTELAVVAGIPVNPVPDVKLSNHRAISETVKAYDLALSPSGNQIAYITSEATEGGEIALIHPDGRTFNQVITSGAHAVGHRGLTWTHDEEELLFVRYIGGPVNAYTIGATTNIGSQTRSIMATGTDYFGVAWAPDKKSFAYYLTTNLYAVDVDRSTGQTIAQTSTIRQIVPVGNVTSWSGMEWANTGRIVYSPVISGGTSEVFVVLAGGGTSMALNPTLPGGATTVFPPLYSPTFSPDWSRVAFVVDSPSTSPHGIYVSDVDGIDARRLTETVGRHLTWDSPGEKIYYIDDSDHICELLVPTL